MDNDTCSEIPSWEIDWNDFACESVCGVIYYAISISPPVEGVDQTISGSFYNFSGLNISTDYTLTIVGINQAGAGDFLIQKFSIATSCYTPVIETTSSGKLVMAYN